MCRGCRAPPAPPAFRESATRTTTPSRAGPHGPRVRPTSVHPGVTQTADCPSISLSLVPYSRRQNEPAEV
ncbi:hypothetical protein EVAR_33315_1 [Eumeta japonica]|uniref:Uncharacterized protein n=1 Tax=Eumeta variegata TaxID=151549 RepID=A0A4C1WEW9_EUMVA|nr:hypothetical protein EVAR_33315_1 [Eumeta japonica]